MRLSASCMLSLFASVSALHAEPVRVSSFGYDAQDATACLQKALDSGARRLVVDRQPGGWHVRPLKLRRPNLELVLEPGVVIRAKRGAFVNGHDTLLSVEAGAENVVIRGGEGSGLAMNRQDYADRSRYAFSTHRHALALRNCRNVTVRDITISDAGGDCIYVYRPADTLIENVTCQRAFRDAMSVIAANRLVVRGCRFLDTSGTAPNCGVDIESNNPKDFLNDILFERCMFARNASFGLCIHLPGLDATVKPVSIAVRDCEMVDNRVDGIVTYAARPDSPVAGMVLVENCRARGNARSALHMTNQEKRGVRFAFKDCVFDGRGGKSPAVAFGNSQISEDFAGVSFDGCCVRTDSPLRLCSYSGMTGTGVTDVRGVWTVEDSEGGCRYDLAELRAKYVPDLEARKFAAAKLDLSALRPAVSGKALPKAVSYPFIRNRFTFVQYVPGAGTYPVRFLLKTLDTARKPKMTIQVRDRPGTDLGSFSTEELSFTYEIRQQSANANIYLFEVECGLGALASVESVHPGQGMLFNDIVNLFACADVPFYFAVPGGAEEVCVQVRPEEEASVSLRDPSWREVDAMPYSRAGKVLRGARKPTKAAEIWCAQLRKVREDAFFRIGAPAVPIAATDPRTVLVTGGGEVSIPEARKAAGKPWVRGVADKRDFLGYAVGEQMRFTITLEDFDGRLDGLKGAWRRTGDDGRSEKGDWNVSEPLAVSTSLDRPGFVRIEAEVLGSDGGILCAFDGGAAAGFASIAQTKPEPRDFDAYWAKRKRELAAVPVKARLTEVPSADPKVRMYSFAVDCAGRHPATGWLQVPSAPGRYPAAVHFHGYGGSWRMGAMRPPKGLPADVIGVTVSPHGCLMNQSAEYYAGFKKAVESNGYTHAFDPSENERPETSYFGEMSWRVMRAVEYVKTLPEWNGKDIVVEGGSQGGLQSIWAAALVPGVTKAEIYIPWCCNMGGPAEGRNHGDWFIEWRPGLDYYDPVNMARRIPKTCRIALSRVGMGDYISPPSGVAAFYNNLKCPKRSAWLQGAQHGTLPPVRDYAFRRDGM